MFSLSIAIPSCCLQQCSNLSLFPPLSLSLSPLFPPPPAPYPFPETPPLSRLPRCVRYAMCSAPVLGTLRIRLYPGLRDLPRAHLHHERIHDQRDGESVLLAKAALLPRGPLYCWFWGKKTGVTLPLVYTYRLFFNCQCLMLINFCGLLCSLNAR